MSPFSRRDFLKLFGLSFTSLGLSPSPAFLRKKAPRAQSVIALEELPYKLVEILGRVPEFSIDSQGYLNLLATSGAQLGRVRQTQTLWNIEHGTDLDLLDTEKPWGIVLHWFGNEEGFADGLSGYLRGFNSERRVEDYTARTSAHFLIGDADPEAEVTNPTGQIGVVQTQKPYQDGTPTFASHLKFLDYESHQNRQQYFVRSLYQLSTENPDVRSVLQTWFDGPRLDPNRVTFAVDVTGIDFDTPSHFPSSQTIANVVGLVWALMETYRVTVYDVLGHNEIDLKKSDPGKQFMATIRLLVGLRTLVKNDPEMNDLVFGVPALLGEGDLDKAEAYLRFVRDYLVLTANPVDVYDWEERIGYWLAYDATVSSGPVLERAGRIEYPGILTHRTVHPFDPPVREGVDIVSTGDGTSNQRLSARLFARGVCLYLKKEPTNAQTRSAIFRHRLRSGAEVISIYSGLSRVEDLEVGRAYPKGAELGQSFRELEFLPPRFRFSVAYAAVWDKEFKDRPYVPYGVDADWIKERFIDPVEFLKREDLLYRLRPP